MGKRFLFRVAAVICGLLPLLVCELALRGLGVGRPADSNDPFVGFSDIHPLFVLNESSGRYEIPKSRQVHFQPDSFAARKPADEFRIFVLGGSTVQGRPWSIESSFTSWLELHLNAADPSRRYEVVNCGGVSYATYRLAPILQEVFKYQPDLVIFCEGHNEFLEDRSYAPIKAQGAAVSFAIRQVSRLNCYNFLRDNVLRVSTRERPHTVLGSEVDARLDWKGGMAEYHRDLKWQAEVIAHFENSLHRIVRIAHDAGVPLILVSPVSNLQYAPFKSEHRSDLTAAQSEEFDVLMKQAGELYSVDLALAAEALRRAIAIDDQFAQAHFELGNCWLEQGLVNEARDEWIKAKDLDICPLRMLEPMKQIIHEVAKATQTPLVDADALIAAKSRSGFPDRQWLVDHVHPSMEGHQLIADAIADTMEEQKFVHRQSGWQAAHESAYREHLASLDHVYFQRGKDRLRSEQGWAHGLAPGGPQEMTAILGISAFYHDSAAALVVDGQIVAAAQEERFSRQKHDAGFPTQAVRYCLAEAGLSAEQLDYVAFYEKPLTKFERILETFVAHTPLGYVSFREAIPLWLKDKLHTRHRIKHELGGSRGPLIFLDHHESHAASAFFPSPFDEAAILTLDGVGEWSTTTLGIGQGHKIRLTNHLQFPHSLGLLYSAFTAYCGFEVNDGEYKLMGLAPYGQPIYAETIKKHLIAIKPDGSFRLNTDYFTFGYRSRMTNRRFDRLFGGPARQQEANLAQRHADLAASVQTVLTEIILRIATELQRRTKQQDLVLAGGVALNRVANKQLLRNSPFSRIWIQPAAGDAGGALGAALFVWHQLLDKPRTTRRADSQRGSFLGPQFSSTEIQQTLTLLRASYQRVADPVELNAEITRRLAAGQIVGWFRGRMEFGPRALGSRSILADARRPEMQALLNQKTKLREGFRPFAPAVLTEHAAEWFDVPAQHESPYMLLTAPVAANRRVPATSTIAESLQSSDDFSRRAAEVRSTIPAVTHVDYSARLQTVDAKSNPDFHALLTEFHRLTGCPVLINTSFNIRGEPIVCTPQDAYRCFATTGIDVLVLEDCIVEKGNASPAPLSSTLPSKSILPVPNTRQLHEFAAIGAVILTGLALWQVIHNRAVPLAAIYSVAAVLLGVVGFSKPRWLAPAFGTWLYLTSPIAWLASVILLAVVFYGIFTPLGLLFRLLGHEALDYRFRTDQDTYWQEKPTAKDINRYFQQF